jgi:hypothetical protein
VALIRDNNGNRDWDVGEPIVATAVTSSTLDAGSGNYRFVGVPAGNYLVHVSDTAAVLADYARGPLGAAGSDGDSQADPYAATLAAGASHMAADFGFYRATDSLAGVIGNLVWGETDGDGLFTVGAGDAGLAGVTVALRQAGETIATTTTGAGGAYAFGYGFHPPGDDVTPPTVAVTRPGDLWLLGEHRLLCADSSDAAAVEGKVAGLVVGRIGHQHQMGLVTRGQRRQAGEVILAVDVPIHHHEGLPAQERQSLGDAAGGLQRAGRLLRVADGYAPGRAGKSGIAVSLVSPREIGSFYYLKLIHKIFPEERHLPSPEELATRREGERYQRLQQLFADRQVSEEMRGLARRVMASLDGERLLGLALAVALDEAQETFARPASAPVSRREQPERAREHERGERPERGRPQAGRRAQYRHGPLPTASSSPRSR